MTGAMAGSTATLHRAISDQLRVITVTINNRCNLSCPHCYLQYSGPSHCIDAATIEAISRSCARHVAIVGKEPLVDTASVALTEQIIQTCAAHGKSISLITNGLKLHRLSDAALAALDWIDISLDGGSATYSTYRRGNFGRVIDNVKSSLARGARAVNALHTVSTANLDAIEDMMAVASLANWSKIIFSPYAEVRNAGTNATSPVPCATLLASLSASQAFRVHSPACLLLGKSAFSDQGLSDGDVAKFVQKAGLVGKVIQVEEDPIRLGYIRITYDGYVMSPYQSLHPAEYRSSAKPLDQYSSIDAAYEHLRAA
jgi:MoaA/NifB/PqqE/SkfB family radical SAM enzyme